MPILCQCDGITGVAYTQATLERAEQIKMAASFGKAVGIVFNATHPSPPPRPEADPEAVSAKIPERRKCKSCTPHIGRILVDQGLRTQEEYDNWHSRPSKSPNKCAECPNTGGCAVNFDLSPLGL